MGIILYSCHVCHQMGVVLYTCHRCSESSDGYYFVFLWQVFKVIKNYQPTLGDELELIEGDYVFMAPGQSSPDGWYSGTSWLTGNTGMFPAVFTQRTSETWIWTLHRWVDVSVAPVSVKTPSFLCFKTLSEQIHFSSSSVFFGFLIELTWLRSEEVSQYQ